MSTLRINFNKNLKMHLACTKDELRPAMNHIYFENGFAYASDGHILVKNKLEECSSITYDQIELLHDKFLHREHYKDILKYDVIEVSDEGIEARKGTEKVFFYFTIDETLKFPSAEKLMQDTFNKQNVNTSRIGFKLECLDRLRKSLHESDNCEFRFKGDSINTTVILESISESASIGLIMPIRID